MATGYRTASNQPLRMGCGRKWGTTSSKGASRSNQRRLWFFNTRRL